MERARSIEQVIERFPQAGRDSLIPILQAVQEEQGYLSEAAVVGIGRNNGNALTLPDYHLSGEHGQVFQEDEQYIYRDLRSTNGSRASSARPPPRPGSFPKASSASPPGRRC